MLRQKGDVLAPLLKGRDLYADDVEPIIQILAEAPGRDLIQQVAVRRRHDAHIHLEGGVASHALDLPLLDGPQELDLHEQGNFADFVQKQRAAVRLQKTPVPALVRAVKAPFSCPNNSDSRRLSVRAAQFTATHGPSLRWLWLWMARATSSLPVPDLPLINTVASEGATVWIISNILRTARLFPTMPSTGTGKRSPDRTASLCSSVLNKVDLS